VVAKRYSDVCEDQRQLEKPKYNRLHPREERRGLAGLLAREGPTNKLKIDIKSQWSTQLKQGNMILRQEFH